jgi:hypothetical protein
VQGERSRLPRHLAAHLLTGASNPDQRGAGRAPVMGPPRSRRKPVVGRCAAQPAGVVGDAAVVDDNRPVRHLDGLATMMHVASARGSFR